MQRLLLLGLNHTTAPLEVREKLAFSSDQRDAAVLALRARFPECEAVLLSTCNRVELYVARGGSYHHPHPILEEMADFLADQHALPPEQFRAHLYHRAGRDVVRHLFRVASSLDSLVLGENQILGQVRESYEAAQASASTGAVLNPLFQRAVAVGKQVRTETALAEGRTSVASVAVDLARRIFETFEDKTALCIGAGKMATLVLEHLVDLKPGRLLLSNRNAEKAAALAAKFNGREAPFDALTDHLAAADIVVTSTGSAEPIITRKMFEKVLRKRRYRPVFLIDIAVPRDVEAAVGDLEPVYLYNVDDLQQVVANTQQQRRSAVDAAEAIVERQVEAFTVWHRQREMGPTIDRLYKRYHRIGREELERTMTKLPPAAAQEVRKELEEMTRRIVNKLLHRPVQALRQQDPQHAEVPYVHAMEKLFDLRPEEGDGEQVPPVPSPAELPQQETDVNPTENVSGTGSPAERNRDSEESAGRLAAPTDSAVGPASRAGPSSSDVKNAARLAAPTDSAGEGTGGTDPAAPRQPS